MWGLSLLLNAAWVVLVFASLDDQALFAYFNSDTLYLPSIFRDLFVDGSGFRGWNLNAAPNFFPDMVSYFAVNALISDFRLAMGVFSLLQYLVLLCFMGWVLRLASQNLGWWHLAASNLCMLLFLFVTTYSGDFVFTFYILSISYHLGPFLMSLFVLVLTFRYLRNGQTSCLIYIAILSFVAVISNRFFIVMFILPLVGFLPFVVRQDSRRRVIKLFSLVAGTGALGILVFNLVKTLNYFHVISTGWKMFQFSQMGSSWQTMRDQHLGYLQAVDFRSLILVLSLLSFGCMFVLGVSYFLKILRNIPFRPAERTQASYTLYFCLFFMVVLFTPVINGSYVGPAILRYNIHVFYLAVFNLGFIASFVCSNPARQKIFKSLVGAAMVLCIAFGVHFMATKGVGKGLDRFINHYPNAARCLDQLAEAQGFQYGISAYWQAKQITMFSKKGVRVYHVYHDTAIWYHVTNQNWYYQGGKGVHADPEFRFVVLNGLEEEAVLKELGPPAQIHQCPGSLKVYEYPPFEFADPRSRRPSIVHGKTEKAF